MKVVLVYKDRFTTVDEREHLQDKELSVEGDKVGVSFIPTENPVAVQILANTGTVRQSRGCLLSALVNYHIEN